MEKQLEAGLTRAIGVSNFNSKQLERVISSAKVVPASLQVELHLRMQQRPLVELCKKHGIVVTAYSPLGSRGTSKIYDSMGIS